MADGSFHVIDYGVHEVHGTTYGSEDGVDVAVRRAILARMDDARESQYETEEGGAMPIDLTCIDAGWQTDAVYSACLTIGAGIMPLMGFGKSSGCTQASFHDVLKRTDDKKPGDGWFLSRKKNLWLVCSDADRWKSWEADRWLTTPGRPGCAYMWGQQTEVGGDRMNDDQKTHHAYAKHLTNEAEVEEPYRGMVRRVWKSKSANNHWLDASCYANVAANIRGIRLGTSSAATAPQRPTASAMPTLAELAKRR
jgi:phage terminase large subunit GpA-like protein